MRVLQAGPFLGQRLGTGSGSRSDLVWRGCVPGARMALPGEGGHVPLPFVSLSAHCSSPFPR